MRHPQQWDSELVWVAPTLLTRRYSFVVFDIFSPSPPYRAASETGGGLGALRGSKPLPSHVSTPLDRLQAALVMTRHEIYGKVDNGLVRVGLGISR